MLILHFNALLYTYLQIWLHRKGANTAVYKRFGIGYCSICNQQNIFGRELLVCIDIYGWRSIYISMHWFPSFTIFLVPWQSSLSVSKFHYSRTVMLLQMQYNQQCTVKSVPINDLTRFIILFLIILQHKQSRIKHIVLHHGI